VTALKYGVNGVGQFIARVGLHDISLCSLRKGLSDNGRLVANRNENEARFGVRSTDFLGRGQSVDAGHCDIADDDVGHYQRHLSHQCLSIGNDVNVIVQGKQRSKVLGHLGMILGQDDTYAGHVAVFLGWRLLDFRNRCYAPE
jgi:hypothetical protein